MTRFHAPLLASLLGLAFLAGCGSPSDSKLAATIPTEGVGSFKPDIGYGWASSKQSILGQCVRQPTVPRDKWLGGRTANLALSKFTSVETAMSSFGVDVGIKAKYMMQSGSFSANVQRESKESKASSVFIYRAEYDFGNEPLKLESMENTELGNNAQVQGLWEDLCGDEVISQVNHRHFFYIVYRIDFASAYAKQKFDAAANLNISAGVTDVEVKAKLSSLAEKFNKTSKITVTVHQSGGDPNELTTALGDGKVFASCDLDDLKACDDLVAAAINYSRQRLPDQLARNPRNPFHYVTSPWKNFNRAIDVAILSQALKTARAELDRKYNTANDIEIRASRMLAQKDKFRIPAEKVSTLTSWRTTAKQRIRDIINAAGVCYEDLKFDPITRQVTSETLNACVAAVNAIPEDQPADSVLEMSGAEVILEKFNSNTNILGSNQLTLRECMNMGRLGIECFPVFSTSTPVVTPDGKGMSQKFTGGSVYWHQDRMFDAQMLYGDIVVKYRRIGETSSVLGHPLSDELGMADGRGRYNDFEKGKIVWSPTTGAHVIRGAEFLEHWRGLGGGVYPTTDVFTAKSPKSGVFIDQITYSAGNESIMVFKDPSRPQLIIASHYVIQAWNEFGGPNGCLGYPTGASTYNTSTGLFQPFEGGYMTGNSALANTSVGYQVVCR